MRGVKRLYWIAQIIGWFSYSSLLFLATYADDPGKINAEFTLNIVSLIGTGILFTHLMRAVIVKIGWLNLKLFHLIPRILIASLICSVFISITTESISFLSNQKGIQEFAALDIIIHIFAVLILILFWNSIYFTFHFFQKSRNQELNNLSLEASRNEIELKNLRSQLNPHFLFNSLNNIRALIDLNPTKAKDSVTTLSNLLRRSLILGKENLIPLNEELEMVSNYLELEKVRFEERLMVQWELNSDLNNFLVPPFCIQTLTENAVKHGISNLVNGGVIIIRTTKLENSIVISVLNTGTIAHSSDSGIGIENTRRRLALQFNGNATFELTQINELVEAKLIFNSTL